jgi:hypothetical protein
MITQRQSQALEEIGRDAFERLNTVTERGPGETRLGLMLSLPYGTVEQFTLDDEATGKAVSGGTFEQALKTLLEETSEEELTGKIQAATAYLQSLTEAKAAVVKRKEDRAKAQAEAQATAKPATPAP